MRKEPVLMGLKELDVRFSGLRLSNPDTEAWLRRSLESEGLREAVVASSGMEPGKRVLLDGFKRIRVLEAMGHTDVPVRMVEADECQSHALMLALNQGRRGLRDIEEGWLVRSLCRRCGMTQSAVGELLGRHKSWVCRRLKLIEHLEEGVQEEIRLGLVSASVARELVPRLMILGCWSGRGLA